MGRLHFMFIDRLHQLHVGSVKEVPLFGQMQ